MAKGHSVRIRRLRVARSTGPDPHGGETDRAWKSPGVRKALRVLRTVRRKLLQRKDVVSVGLGQPEQGGRRQGRAPFGIVVGVRKKLPPGEIPARRLLPRSISGVRIDVVESDPTFSAGECLLTAEDRRTGAGVTSLRGGLALGDASTGSFLGSLCAHLVDAQGDPHALTANHVAKGHPDMRSPLPAPGTPCRVIATAPAIDSAIARWGAPVLPPLSGAHGGATAWSALPIPGPNTVLLVGGACSGEIVCRITEVEVSVPAFGLRGLIKIEARGGEFFRAGDSGGCLMTRDRGRLVGMFIAGNTPGIASRGFAVPIGPILRSAARIGLRLV